MNASELPADAWKSISFFLEESDLFQLRLCGSKRLLESLRAQESIVLRDPSKFLISLPTCITPSLKLYTLIVDVDPYASGPNPKPLKGFELQNLPKTLTDLRLKFQFAFSPFVVDRPENIEANLAHLHLCLPQVSHLELCGAPNDRIWTIPSSVTYFAASGGHLLTRSPLPPSLEHLILPSESETKFPAVSLPWTLKTLRTHLVCEIPAQCYDLSTLLLHKGFKSPKTIIVPEYIRSLYLEDFEPANFQKRFPSRLTSLHVLGKIRSLQIKDLPDSLIHFYETKRTKCHYRPGTLQIESENVADRILPNLLSVRVNSWYQHVPNLFYDLSPHVTSLHIEKVRLKDEDFEFLPRSLTDLRLAFYNDKNAKQIAALDNLKHFAAYSGKLSARNVKKLPRGLISLQFIRVGLDRLSLREKRDGSNNNRKFGPKIVDMSALRDTLPPALQSLRVFHSHINQYYFTHTYEIYSGLPTSLTSLSLEFENSTRLSIRRSPLSGLPVCLTPAKDERFYPAKRRAKDADNIIFTRLHNLRYLRISRIAAASYEHSIPPLPSSLTSLDIQCWVSFTLEDVQAIPKSLRYLRVNLQCYSHHLNDVRKQRQAANDKTPMYPFILE